MSARFVVPRLRRAGFAGALRGFVLGLAVLLVASACGGARRDSTPETVSPSAPETVPPLTLETVPRSTPTIPATGCDGGEIIGGTVVTCSVPGWSGRDFDLHVPDEYDPARRWPVVIAYHGGGGTRQAGARTSCPDGDLSDPGCLHALGMREGFITVYPDGTSRGPAGRIRTWNAGGSGTLTCVVGAACEKGADDVAYTSALLDVLDAHYTIEPRVIATGLSNGGAMAHRAGCDLSERVRVVVAFGGANQQPGCIPTLPVSVMQVHGTEDPCWPFDGGALGGCFAGEALVSGVLETAQGWAGAQHCASPSESMLLDRTDDGMTSEVTRWEGCDGGAVVELVTVIGGGHSWPMGYSVAPRIVGSITSDYSGSELLWEFAQEIE